MRHTVTNLDVDSRTQTPGGAAGKGSRPAHGASGKRPRGGARPDAAAQQLEPTRLRELVAELEAEGSVRVNNRTIWILQIVAAESDLSNRQVAERAGGMPKSHVCTILGRLKRLGLIENTNDDPTPYVPNAWCATARGERLVEAVRRERSAPLGNNSYGAPAGGHTRASAPHSNNHRGDPRRARALAAAVRIAVGDGPPALTPERVASSARISSSDFAELFRDIDACLLAAVDEALDRVALSASGAYNAREGWLDSVRTGLLAVLEFFDAEPLLARLLITSSAQAGPAVQARRSEVVARIARVLDDEGAPARHFPPTLTAEAVVTGVLGVLHGRISAPEAGPFVEMLGPLMSFIVTPYLGAKAARRELSRTADRNGAPLRRQGAVAILQGSSVLQGSSGQGVRDQRAVRALGVVAVNPGLSNAEVAAIAEVTDEGQISRLLARLARLGLIENHNSARGVPGGRNSWFLTSRGEAFQRALGHKHASANGGGECATGAVVQTATCCGGRRHIVRRRRLRGAHA